MVVTVQKFSTCQESLQNLTIDEARAELLEAAQKAGEVIKQCQEEMISIRNNMASIVIH